MTSSRTVARWGGGLYFLTHVTSVGAVLLYGGASYAADAPLAGRGGVLSGAVLEILLALGIVGTGVVIHRLVRERSAVTASGYLALRTLEASVILAGVVTLLPLVARPATTTAPGLEPGVEAALRLVHDWTFLIGPGLIVPFHTVLLACHLWRSRRTPRFIPVLGLVGGPVVGAMNLSVMLGFTDVLPLAAVPVFLWEISLAVWLIARGSDGGGS